MRTLSSHLIAGLVLGLVIIAGAAPAGASQPGHNGQIAFGRYDPLVGDTVIYTINPDGTHEHQILSFGAELPHWSPDGSRIATAGSPSNGAAVVTNPDDGSHVELPRTSPGLDNYCFVWSADAARLACEAYGQTDGGRNGIYSIRSSDGGGLARVTAADNASDIPGDYSPNGRRLVYGHFGEDCGCLSVVNVNGTGLRHLGEDLGISSSGSWSPQGNEIVFSRHVTPDVHSSLWVIHADGSGLHQIDVQVSAGQFPCGAPNSDPTAGGCFDPRWSPDGRKVVFGRGDDDLGRDVYTVNADGSGLTAVTHGGGAQSNESADWGTHPLAG